MLGLVLMAASIPLIFVSAYLGIVMLDEKYSYGAGLFTIYAFMGYFTYRIFSSIDKPTAQQKKEEANKE